MFLRVTSRRKSDQGALLENGGSSLGSLSVADLLEELAQRQEVPEDLRDAALELDKAYISSRYPDAHPSGSPRRRYIRAEAERLIEYAAKIVRFCEGLLSALEP